MTNMCSLYFGEVETWNYSIHKEPFAEMLTEHNNLLDVFHLPVAFAILQLRAKRAFLQLPDAYFLHSIVLFRPCSCAAYMGKCPPSRFSAKENPQCTSHWQECRKLLFASIGAVFHFL